MSPPFDIAVFVGSLRKESLSRKVALSLASLAPASLKLSLVEIGHLPLYNPDDEAAAPDAWVALRERIRSAHGVLFVTPEYNRSVPAVLKNALDVGSRPPGQSAWNGKPGGVVSLSQGALGGFGANHHLRQSLVFLNVPTLQQPEAYLGAAGNYFGADGTLVNESVKGFLKKYIDAFGAWVELHAAQAAA